MNRLVKMLYICEHFIKISPPETFKSEARIKILLRICKYKKNQYI